MSVPQPTQPIQIRPIINYPREAQIGQTYLMTIDVQLASPDASWPYPDEEYPITFILNTQPYFRYEPLNGERDPGIVLHRFGGTYGPAQYLLTASEQEVERGHISITFLNGWDLPMTYLELECVVTAELAENKAQEISVLSEKKATTASKASLIVEEAQLSSEEIESAEATEIDGLQESVEEETGYILIAEQLKQAGWTFYHFVDEKLIDYFSDRHRREGIAVAGHPSIPDGYTLFIARQLVGVIKTRPIGAPLTSVEATETLIGTMERLLSISIIRTGYSTLPFFYGITGAETYFTNYLEPESQSRQVFSFHRPETLAKWLELAPPNVPVSQNNLFRSRLKRMPTLQRKGLRKHQFEAIGNLESSLALNNRHALIQMETGTGVTFTALNIIHRLLKYGGARRILYALDTSMAKDYATDILQEFVPANEIVKFINLYDTDYMRSNRPDPSASVCVATLEQFYIAFVADLPTSPPGPSSSTRTAKYPEISYNPTFPIEYFDAIVLGNWDSHLQQTWQPFLDYFDAFIIGMTDDADKQLVSQFADNLVYEQAAKLSQGITYRDNALIFTTLPSESEAVRRHLSKRRQETDGEAEYERGEFADRQWHWEVGIAQVEMDNAEAIDEALRAIRYFDPSIILFVGIAAGLKDTNPGDVVVANTVASFELNTAQEGQLTFLPRISASNEQLLQKARIESHMHNWMRRIRYGEQEQTLEKIAPRVLIGQLMTAPTIGTALRFFRQFPNDALAMELGSRDLFYNVYNDVDLSPDTELLIIRGISDQIDSQKERETPGSQERAAHHAAAFAFEILAKLGVDGAAKLDAELSASSVTATQDTKGNFEIFYDYASQDASYVAELKRHLTSLTRQDDITEWDVNTVMLRKDWRKGLERHMDTARVILLFISLDFLASEQFSAFSWQRVLERESAGKVAIIPILLHPTDWQNIPPSRLPVLPRNGVPVSSHDSEDQALAEIAQEITRAVERLRAGEA